MKAIFIWADGSTQHRETNGPAVHIESNGLSGFAEKKRYFRIEGHARETDREGDTGILVYVQVPERRALGCPDLERVDELIALRRLRDAVLAKVDGESQIHAALALLPK